MGSEDFHLRSRPRSDDNLTQFIPLRTCPPCLLPTHLPKHVRVINLVSNNIHPRTQFIVPSRWNKTRSAPATSYYGAERTAKDREGRMSVQCSSSAPEPITPPTLPKNRCTQLLMHWVSLRFASELRSRGRLIILPKYPTYYNDIDKT